MAEVQTNPSSASKKKSQGASKYVLSFAVMIALAAISFIAVATGALSVGTLIPILLGLAMLQVLMQLFNFMHLSEKGSGFPITFIFSGLFFGLICVVALVFLL